MVNVYNNFRKFGYICVAQIMVLADCLNVHACLRVVVTVDVREIPSGSRTWAILQ